MLLVVTALAVLEAAVVELVELVVVIEKAY
jgi:hypothetical protein